MISCLPLMGTSKGYKPGSVLLEGCRSCFGEPKQPVSLFKPLPFIQPDGLPPDRQQPTPRLGRAALQPRARIETLAQSSIGVHGLATRSPYGCRHCCRHRWSLTPPFHPCLAGLTRGGRGVQLRRLFSVTVARTYARLAVSPVRCPVLPGLSSPPGSPVGAGSSGRAPLLVYLFSISLCVSR